MGPKPDTLAIPGTGTGDSKSSHVTDAMPQNATVQGAEKNEQQIVYHQEGHDGSTTEYVSCPSGFPIPGIC